MSIVVNLFVTLFVGILGGVIAFFLNLPIPWLIGSALIVLFCKKVPYVKSPNKVFAKWMRVLLGVAIGGSVATSLSTVDSSLFVSLGAAIVFVAFVTIVGVWYFGHLSGFNRLDSFMSALPGGLTFLVSLSGELGSRFPKIALIHTVRIVFLIFVFSVFAYFLDSPDDVEVTLRSSFAFSFDPELWQIALLVTFSGLLSNKLNIAGGHIMFPLIISAICYMNGWIELPAPEIVNTIAMVTFGAVIGCKLSAGSFREYMPQMKASIVFSTFAISTALLMALGLSEMFGGHYFLYFLALAPGSIPEISLIALALGFDVGFVALVHTCRYLFIMLIGALGLSFYQEREPETPSVETQHSPSS